MVADGLLQNRERALRNFVLLQLADLALIQVRLGDVDVLTAEPETSGQYCPRDYIVLRIQLTSSCPVMANGVNEMMVWNG